MAKVCPDALRLDRHEKSDGGSGRSHLSEPQGVAQRIFQKLAHAAVGIASDGNKYRTAFMRGTGVDALAIVPDHIIADVSQLQFVNLGPVIGVKGLVAEVGGLI